MLLLDTPQVGVSAWRHLGSPLPTNLTQGLQRITVLQSLAGISEEKVEAIEPQDWTSPRSVECEGVHSIVMMRYDVKMVPKSFFWLKTLNMCWLLFAFGHWILEIQESLANCLVVTNPIPSSFRNPHRLVHLTWADGHL